MKNIDIIVMGKTGAGKSTLINAVLNDNFAPTGTGQPITVKNQIYSKQVLLPIGTYCDGHNSLVECTLNMYDTVGLEIDNAITNKTLEDIRKHIEYTKAHMDSTDIHIVWFCVNAKCNRFEVYELNLIKMLSIDYEIPFVIVLTQCLNNEESELEKQIGMNTYNLPISRVLAKDYTTRKGGIKAYGVTELLQKSILDYNKHKINILQSKLDGIDKKRNEKIKELQSECSKIIFKYCNKAQKIGVIPGGCIPFVYGIAIKMINELNKPAKSIAGMNVLLTDFKSIINGLVLTPGMLIPKISNSVAMFLVFYIGNTYLITMLNVISKSSELELENETLIRERIKEELNKLKIGG